MAKKYGPTPMGRAEEFEATLPHPERTARRCGVGMFPDYFYQEWPNRAAMARSIRMQERRASKSTDWRAVVPLSMTEGY